MARWGDKGLFAGKDEDSHQFGEPLRIVYAEKKGA
jgi:hypothetical protein